MTDKFMYAYTIDWFEKRGIRPDKFRLDGDILVADCGNISYVLGYLGSPNLVGALNNYFRMGSSRVTRHINKLKQLQKDRGK